MNHSHRDRTGNSVLFDGILEMSEVLIREDLNINVSIVSITNLHFQAPKGSVARTDIDGLTAQL